MYKVEAEREYYIPFDRYVDTKYRDALNLPYHTYYVPCLSKLSNKEPIKCTYRKTTEAKYP